MDNTNSIFDASAISDNKVEMTKEDLINEIYPKLLSILKQSFPNTPQKQEIKIYKDRISFAAPCCGDSAKDNSKKRGNIILEGKFSNMYKCHNCGTCMSIYNFFKKFKYDLSIRTIDYIIASNKHLSRENSQDASLNLMYDAEIIDDFAIDREYFKTKCHLEECNIPGYANNYLRSRMQFHYDKFLYHRLHNLLFVLNLTPTGKILGVQVRNLNKNYAGPKYKTYKLSKIYSILLHETRDVPENIDKLSITFNILLANYNTPITVVEGPMDSFLIKNSIALCGAGHSLPFDFKYKYLFDDDLTGRKHALEKLNEGCDVFTWDKLKKDICLPQRKKWDINDLVIYCYSNKIQIPPLANYYSSNSLDLLDI